MKKIIVAFLAGALVMASGQAIADTASRIGKKVVSEAEVLLNGSQLSNAIIVDGKSYAPLRDIVEAFGADVTYSSRKDDKALIEIKQSSKFPSADVMKEQSELKREKEDLERKLNEEITGINSLETEMLPMMESNLEKYEEGTNNYKEGLAYIQEWKDKLSEKKELVKQYETRITEINNRLSELESTK